MAMADEDARETTSPLSGFLDELPVERLKEGAQDLLAALVERAVGAVGDQLEGMTERLDDYAEHGGPGLLAALTGSQSLARGESPVKAALGAGMTGVKEKAKQALGGSGGSSGSSGKVTTIIEDLDVGVPIRVAYDQWTRFRDFPSFTRKVESVEQESDEKLTWRAQIFLSHRSWEATILEQVPESRIVWRSQGSKGYVDGAVTFHALTENMTRILLVLEYHPQGFFEKTGNIWRAPGRRARADFKHFRRHVMTRTILEPEQVEGWRGEIRDGEVVLTHEDALDQEQREHDGSEGSAAAEYDEEDEAADGYDEDGYDDEWAEDDGGQRSDADPSGEPGPARTRQRQRARPQRGR